MGSDKARNSAVDVLPAKEAIREDIYRYAHGEDRQDGALSTSLWRSDGTATYGYRGEIFDGSASEWAKTHAGLRSYTGTSHQISNIIIEVDSDRAVGESYVTARLWRIDGDGQIWRREAIGRYLDRWSYRDGQWGVDRRFIFELSNASVTPPVLPETSPGKAIPSGSRDDTAPVTLL